MLRRRKSYIRTFPRETHKNDKEAGYSQWFYLSWEVGETQLLTRIFKFVFYNLHFLTHCVFCNGIVCLSLLIATNQTNKMEIQTKKWKSKPTKWKSKSTNPKQMEIQTNRPKRPSCSEKDRSPPEKDTHWCYSWKCLQKNTNKLNSPNQTNQPNCPRQTIPNNLNM